MNPPAESTTPLRTRMRRVPAFASSAAIEEVTLDPRPRVETIRLLTSAISLAWRHRAKAEAIRFTSIPTTAPRPSTISRVARVWRSRRALGWASRLAISGGSRYWPDSAVGSPPLGGLARWPRWAGVARARPGTVSSLPEK